MTRIQQTLKWCRFHTGGYEGVDIKNLSTSWKDGKALCALVHHFQPSLLDYDECLKLTDEERVELALKKMKDPDALQIIRMVVQNCRQEEIAESLGITQSAISRKIRKIRAALQQAVQY